MTQVGEAVQVGQVSTPVQEVRAVSFHELSLPPPTVWSSAEEVIGDNELIGDSYARKFVRFRCDRTESAEEDDVRSEYLILPKRRLDVFSFASALL
jgi:hypothetical protein